MLHVGTVITKLKPNLMTCPILKADWDFHPFLCSFACVCFLVMKHCALSKASIVSNMFTDLFVWGLTQNVFIPCVVSSGSGNLDSTGLLRFGRTFSVDGAEL